MVSIKVQKLEDLTPYENNPRRNEKAIEAVRKSIESFGFINPIIVDQDGVIICGHTRYAAAKKMDLQEAPTIIVDDLTEEQEKAFRIVDNKVSEGAEWDKDLLRDELAAIKDMYDMTDFGFKEDDRELEAKLKGTKHQCPRCGHQW